MFNRIGIGVGIVGVLVTGYFYVQKTPTLVGIVVPHHDMVASVRQAYFKKISSEFQPKTIVVLVPDHFNQSTQPLTTTRRSFETILGTIEPDTAVIDSLALPESEQAFLNEHGLTTLLKDIKQYFSNARIVPVMLSRNATYDEVNEFTVGLNAICPDCFVVASVDFSHTNTANVAALHDELVLREMSQLDSVTLYKQAEVDSPEALVGLVLWARLHGAEKFELFSHTNSGYLADKAVGEMTTHIIGGYEHGKQQFLNDDVVTFMFGGDTMFARSVHDEYMQASTSPFAGLGERFFWGVDVAMVNLEGAFTNDANFKDEWETIPPKLLLATDYGQVLKSARISAVGFANNHTFDGGVETADFTRRLLEEQKLLIAGYPRTEASVVVKEQGDTKVAVIAIAAHEEREDIASQVREFSGMGYRVIAYVHWGDEYVQKHNETQEAIAKRLVEAGADLIVGSHPHVVQDVAVYQGVPIVYSLGNFLFDQNFRVETQVGAVLGVKLTEKELEVFFIPISNYNSVAVLPENQYKSYIESWTTGWGEYETDFDHFVFPLKD